MSNFIIVIVLRSSFLTLELSLPFSISSIAFPRRILSSIEFYSVRIATLLPSRPAVRSIARSSAKLSYISLFYSSFVQSIVDFDYYPNNVRKYSLVSSETYKFVLNVVLKSSIVYSN